ncbi:protein BCCIP homolog [Limulus polyphemus]|uniref:Protein BCCIP homolog n=1 Tax=Limulus polyphemus TaxID=6850 RepID=A0ABM1BS16_LIMPO|nr:protein BCCIP homolog [Limulus polyphemus]
MAASKKKRGTNDMEVDNGREEKGEDHEHDNSEPENNSSDDELVDTEVQVDFEATTPDDSDFHGIKKLLQQMFLKAHVNLSELADLVIKQNYVSSVIKQSEIPEDEEEEDEEDVLGVISVVNMMDKKELGCVKQIKSLLLDRCKENASVEIQQKFLSLFSETTNALGLVLNERFVNIPTQIALPLFNSLNNDIEEANKRKLKFNFSHYLFICKIYKPKEEKKQLSETLIYSNAEEELIEEESELQFDFSVETEADSALGGMWKDDDEEFKPYRRVIVIPATRWPNIISKLKEELSPS